MTGVKVRVWQVEVDMVESVLRVQPQLEAGCFGHGDALCKRQVGAVHSWPMQSISAGIAKCSDSLGGERRRVEVEMICGGPRILRHDGGHLVGIVCTPIVSVCPAGTRLIKTAIQGNRESGLQGGDAANFPSLEDSAQSRTGTQSVRNWNFVPVAGYEALARIELRIAPIQLVVSGERVDATSAGLLPRRAFVARPIIYRVRISVRQQEIQPMRGPLL